MNLEFSFTWIASLLCATGICIVAVSALRHRDHWIVRDPLFLPLYFAGIVQWVIWGIRIGDAALIYPCFPQLLLLTPTLYRWYKLRVQ